MSQPITGRGQPSRHCSMTCHVLLCVLLKVLVRSPAHTLLGCEPHLLSTAPCWGDNSFLLELLPCTGRLTCLCSLFPCSSTSLQIHSFDPGVRSRNCRQSHKILFTREPRLLLGFALQCMRPVYTVRVLTHELPLPQLLTVGLPPTQAYFKPTKPAEAKPCR